jgi:hypothetical protein
MNTILTGQKILRLTTFVMSLLLLSGCATFEAMKAEADARYQARVCSYEGAFTLGTNDAQADRPMRSDVAARCHDLAVRPEVSRGYREGYTQARTHQPVRVEIDHLHRRPATPPTRRPHYECRAVAHRDQVCGYNCTKIDDHWYCANDPSHRYVKKGKRIMMVPSHLNDGSPR